MSIDLETGLLQGAEYLASPNYDDRDTGSQPEVIIVHCISLPPGRYGGGYVEQFFLNQLPSEQHEYFREIEHLQVSSHFFVARDGRLVQFVPTNKRAWHAGESVCYERPKVNNFSIGIELEGLDTDPDGFTASQYDSLKKLIKQLQRAYPKISTTSVFAHSDIAPGRKTDPGPYFNWNEIFN